LRRNDESSSTAAKAVSVIAAPAMLTAAFTFSAPADVGVHLHQAAAGYYAPASYALLTDHDELPHNEPTGEFIHVEDAPTMGTAVTMHGPRVWPGGL
jgi:hypothetical protein